MEQLRDKLLGELILLLSRQSFSFFAASSHIFHHDNRIPTVCLWIVPYSIHQGIDRPSNEQDQVVILRAGKTLDRIRSPGE